ncbi:YjzD family protein [Ligilactobacillus apodemi]|uniref:DUF2929 domain-containing protein n=1 Tax=Ligilactobacillus apodemi DSM 16634 = JCM 16172 TaxID=1423724 RepID=A0A0R1TRB5_9LACO|nr:YjzD family protein [Ligilactobacillus apodemi]KRL83967.1 hypothetical protein FC32_GL001237 [Ligilactobacillus apodemi DSM 16634 = JCM 16172]MCR1900808.1 YjzD family protein [Ligilactobacillus apodemi]
MAKQLTILFWGFIYGEVIGYVLSALDATQFQPVQSGVIAMIGGFIAINCLQFFVKSPKEAKKNK